jgi:hypothetical protein
MFKSKSPLGAEIDGRDVIVLTCERSLDLRRAISTIG